MNEQNSTSWKSLHRKAVSRRNLICVEGSRNPTIPHIIDSRRRSRHRVGDIYFLEESQIFSLASIVCSNLISGCFLRVHFWPKVALNFLWRPRELGLPLFDGRFAFEDESDHLPPDGFGHGQDSVGLSSVS